MNEKVMKHCFRKIPTNRTEAFCRLRFALFSGDDVTGDHRSRKSGWRTLLSVVFGFRVVAGSVPSLAALRFVGAARRAPRIGCKQ